MRLCRFRHDGRLQIGFYDNRFVAPLPRAAAAYTDATHEKILPFSGDDLIDYLPPDGKQFAAAKKVADWLVRNAGALPADARLELSAVQLLVPIPRPNKLLLLAGNYNEHLQEGGGAATERAETFPYVFTKP